MSPEVSARLAVLKQKASENTLTIDEMREGVRLMREDRKVASTVSAVSRTKRARAEIKSADEMLDELGKI